MILAYQANKSGSYIFDTFDCEPLEDGGRVYMKGRRVESASDLDVWEKAEAEAEALRQ